MYLLCKNRLLQIGINSEDHLHYLLLTVPSWTGYSPRSPYQLKFPGSITVLGFLSKHFSEANGWVSV